MGNSSTKSRPNSPDTSMNTSYIRRAYHSGSWYEDDPRSLDKMLTKFLADASESKSSDAYETESTTDSENNVASDSRHAGIPRACISPHAGFSYSGPTAAYSFLALKEALLSNPSLRTIVVLHPSHHAYLDGCAISGARELLTPIRNLQVDDELREQLLSTGKFSTMKQGVDEREHSGEMQYPFIAKIIKELEDQNMSEHANLPVKVLPIMVGSIKRAKEEAFGKVLASFLGDEHIFTVISSDFCHWGARFSYTPQPSRDANDSINEIHEYIEYLDRKGMNLIAMQRPGAFADYLRDYSNTICGRHPIAVWLYSVVANKETGKENLDVRFVKYAQSGKALSVQDSSVSYASAVARLFSNGS